MQNTEAVETTIQALTDLGRVAPLDAALVELCRAAARALDEFPTRATLIKEYRECLQVLCAVGMDDDGDALEDLLRDINAGTAVGDSSET